MQEVTVKFKASIPDGHAEAGKELEGSATFLAPENDAEAQSVLAEKKISLTKVVYDRVKSLAVSSARQTLLAPYTAKEISEDDAREKMIRALIQSGKTADEAKQIVAVALG